VELAGTLTSSSFVPALTPRGRLRLEPADDGAGLDPLVAERVRAAFERGSGHGLLQLGAGEIGRALPPQLGYWRDFASRYIAAVCARPEAEGAAGRSPMPAPADGDLRALAEAGPPMTGAETLSSTVLAALWEELDLAFHEELDESSLAVQDFLQRRNPAWNLVGRVHFNLAENRRDETAPFAFLATYTARLSAHAKPQHLPLGDALREYAGASRRERLLSLLLPVQRAAAACPWLREMVDAGEIFHPLRWTPQEAYRFLTDVPALEAAGVVVRVPAGWTGNRPPRPQVRATVGGATPGGLATDALLDFHLDIVLDGEPLTAAEVAALLASVERLALVRGRWVEVDRDKLHGMLEQLRRVEHAAEEGGLSFGDAARLLAGADVAARDGAAPDPGWTRVVAGPWLAEVLRGLRRPDGLARVDAGAALHGTLRPYQQVGLRWLHLLARLGLGACLADDMGLGKTVQVLALLLVLRARDGARDAGRVRPSLLVAPASLLANWAREAERFAPDLRVRIAHPSVMTAAELKALGPEAFAGSDLVVTSYGSLLRLSALAKAEWRLAILDEAQAIKNPEAKQTRAVKGLRADARLALTGTPIENRLTDLWSIFDFLQPGLLGSVREFALFTKRLEKREHDAYAPLRELVRPYILRRLKTDRTVIDDLPEKTEMTAFCPLAKKQAALYRLAVDDLRAQLQEVDGMKRRGVVLAFLMRFKQICNHPSHWLGDGSWAESDSGKLGRLREIAETIAARQEKALVFTQFREAAQPLADFLASVFGRAGLILHGAVPVRQRKDLVARFQDDESVPFFVLSLKAGGAGLNLTAASHVVHFDRWWNPAVENQATDRAFRIGQKRNVVVHKFVCRGTVEEKIDTMIEAKRQLASGLLEGGAELRLTEMKDEELLKLVALDLQAVAQEG